MTLRILVVEDEALLADCIASLLRARGYHVAVAHHGAAGLACMTEQPPDLILLDVGMPVLDGPETLRELRRRPAHTDTPVVMMSASEESFPPRDGATRYQARLRKPFSEEQLLAAIASCIGSGARRGGSPEWAPE